MGYGVLVNGRRPASKKAVKEAVASGARVSVDSTSMFGNEPSGFLQDLPDGRYDFCGPDPYTKRNFYGNLIVIGGRVTVK